MSTKQDYFTQKDEALLYAAASAWLGTPFRAGSCLRGPGGGVDCVRFVAAVLSSVGAIDEPLAFPAYELNHATHSDFSELAAWFHRPEIIARVRKVDDPAAPSMPGDLLFIREQRAIHHLGMQIGQSLFHVVRPAGVQEMGIALPWVRKSIAARYRLLAP